MNASALIVKEGNVRIAVLELTPPLFTEFAKFCKDGPPRYYIVKENALPDDAEIVDVDLKDGRYWRLFIQSESFADVPRGVEPPVLPPILFDTVYAECTALPA